jgi:hypothetical protein
MAQVLFAQSGLFKMIFVKNKSKNMKTKYKILMLFSAIILSVFSYSQSLTPVVISSGGGYFASASLSYTIAEMTMVQTFTTSGNILTQGFQQPEDISVGIQENDADLNNFAIYPNPTSGAFTLDFISSHESTVSVKLFNLFGQEVLTNNYSISEGINKISFDIGTFSQGVYLLEISYDSYKVIDLPILKKITLVY